MSWKDSDYPKDPDSMYDIDEVYDYDDPHRHYDADPSDNDSDQLRASAPILPRNRLSGSESESLLERTGADIGDALLLGFFRWFLKSTDRREETRGDKALRERQEEDERRMNSWTYLKYDD